MSVGSVDPAHRRWQLFEPKLRTLTQQLRDEALALAHPLDLDRDRLDGVLHSLETLVR
ncbi:MAG: hypothetical protein JWN53_2390, partial [Gemmatimonadetes bacterium]|nr:hypothetical protein [Gemmatimonadota bacterium]